MLLEMLSLDNTYLRIIKMFEMTSSFDTTTIVSAIGVAIVVVAEEAVCLTKLVDCLFRFQSTKSFVSHCVEEIASQ